MSGLAWSLLQSGSILVETGAVAVDAVGMRDDQQGGDADDAEARLRMWVRLVVL